MWQWKQSWWLSIIMMRSFVERTDSLPWQRRARAALADGCERDAHCTPPRLCFSEHSVEAVFALGIFSLKYNFKTLAMDDKLGGGERSGELSRVAWAASVRFCMDESARARAWTATGPDVRALVMHGNLY